MEMPRYRSHKEVRALQIKSISGASDDEPQTFYVLSFVDEQYAQMTIKAEVVSRYMPKEGDYFVIYDDGYQSISPKAAFEEGYRLIISGKR